MTKADFVWTVGYQGNTAMVNAERKREYPNPDSMVLLERGLLRPSFCAALWDNQSQSGSIDTWLEKFCTKTRLSLKFEEVQRLLGVYVVPDPKTKSKAL